MRLSFDHPPSLVRYEDERRQLILRPARVDDAAAIFEAIEESMAALRQFMPWSHLTQTLEGQRERLVQLDAGYGEGGDVVFHLYEGE